jgi:hypothetical protein
VFFVVVIIVGPLVLMNLLLSLLYEGFENTNQKQLSASNPSKTEVARRINMSKVMKNIQIKKTH